MADDDESAAAPTIYVGIGASAGGVEALTAFVRRLPASFGGAVLVVLHVAPSGTSVLPQILDRAGPLPARAAQDGDRPLAGHIYVAPPDRHVVVDDGHLRLSAGPRENGHRPAVDPLLRSLAEHDGLAVGAVLSGTRDDGTQGLARLKAAGGRTFVQDPQEALYDGMIRSAMQHVAVDAVLPVGRLADELTVLARPNPQTMTHEHPHHHGDHVHPDEAEDGATSATRYTCPECGGSLWREEEDNVVRFRCSVGHAYSPDSLDGEQARNVEGAVWAAARLLGDRQRLLEEMAGRARDAGHTRSADGFAEQATEAGAAAATLRRLLETGQIPTGGTSAAG